MNISKLHLLIDSKNLSKVKLSAMTGISDVTISNILKGADAKISSIEALASALGVPVGYFFDDDTTPKINANTVKGNNNVLVGGSNHVTINKLNECEREVEILRMEIKHLTSKIEEKDKYIAEKERLINVLMKNQQ